ncbi:murein hydrolase activator EnvC family protein [Vallicoccus soli]|uniref:M23ase beta-sheet core domain-containing protein n=1 Tax=Vallicoccus soli TaxID=2339232 RepID=A0A3A3Z4H4_9ACTN|nr:M23 family metallopeptidase [Vallicoccus soli]RJK95447.1 hypothetical protein D5H78_12405 [Vallicoccus soli]
MRARPVGLVAVATAITLGVVVPAAADDAVQRKAAVDASVEQLRHDLAETDAELARAVLDLRSAEADLGPARARVAAAHGRIVAAQARVGELERELERAQKRLRAAQRELQRLEEGMAQRRTTIGAMASETYQRGALSEVAVVLEAQTPDDLTDRLAMLREVVRSSDHALDELAADRGRVSAHRASLTEDRERTERLKAEAEEQLERVRRLEEQARAAQAEVEGLVARRAAAAAVVERERAGEQRRLAELEAERSRLQAVLVERARAAKARAEREAAERRAAAEAAAAAAQEAERERSSGSGSSGSSSSGSSSSGSSGSSSSGGSSADREDEPPRASRSSSGFERPVSYGITSPFGMRTNPVTGIYKLHDGTDFGAPCGTSIRSTAPGEVVWAEYRGGYGYQVAVDHGIIDGESVVSLYSHIESGGFRVGPGEQVSQGESIASVGTTGNSTGCHLHFSIYVDGSPEDPMSYL